METTLIKRKGPTLSFVPEAYREEFVDSVLHFYTINAEVGDSLSAGLRNVRMIPDVQTDIAGMSRDIYLAGCMARDEGKNLSLAHVLVSQSSSERARELLEELHEEFAHPCYNDWYEEYVEDIVSVLQFYGMVFFTSEPQSWLYPHGPRFYEIHNAPIVRVW